MAIGGKNSVWKHGTVGAPTTLTDLANTREASFDAEGETVDATVWGDGFRAHEQSFKNATVSSQYKYTPAVFAALGALFSSGEEVDFELSPDGEATGDALVSGKAFITTFGSPVTLGDLVVQNIDWQVTGPVLFDVHS